MDISLRVVVPPCDRCHDDHCELGQRFPGTPWGGSRRLTDRNHSMGAFQQTRRVAHRTEREDGACRWPNPSWRSEFGDRSVPPCPASRHPKRTRVPGDTTDHGLPRDAPRLDPTRRGLYRMGKSATPRRIRPGQRSGCPPSRRATPHAPGDPAGISVRGRHGNTVEKRDCRRAAGGRQFGWHSHGDRAARERHFAQPRRVRVRIPDCRMWAPKLRADHRSGQSALYGRAGPGLGQAVLPESLDPHRPLRNDNELAQPGEAQLQHAEFLGVQLHDSGL